MATRQGVLGLNHIQDGQDGLWPGVVGSSHRNTKKNMQKSSSLESLGLNA